MPGRTPGLTTSQKGAISEYFVATALRAASDGRLSPFVPLSDDHGIDLIVLDKKTGRSVSVQVKSWIGGAAPSRRTVQFDVRKATYRADGGAVLLAVVLRPTPISMEACWLIPMSEVPRLAVERPEKYALSPSRAADSNDRYSPYRHADVPSLVAALIGVLGGIPPER